jgi:hypothetical protein
VHQRSAALANPQVRLLWVLLWPLALQLRRIFRLLSWARPLKQDLRREREVYTSRTLVPEAQNPPEAALEMESGQSLKRMHMVKNWVKVEFTSAIYFIFKSAGIYFIV